MSDLKDLLLGAGEAKRQLFAGEDFAGGYGSTVIGRVKRRRAVSASALGGGTVVAVGALAFGAANVPWSSYVRGASPASSPSVICTTTTPDAVVGSAVSVPDGATLAVVDDTTGAVFFVGSIEDGVAAAWTSDGLEAPLVRSTTGDATLALPSGKSVILGPGDTAPAMSVSQTSATGVSVMPVERYLQMAESTVIVIAEDGTVLGRAIHADDGGLALVDHGNLYPLSDPDGLTYGYVDGTGQTQRVTLVDNDPSAGAFHGPATPVVTCVSTTPEPTASPRQSPTVSPTPDPTVSPTPDPTGSPTGGWVWDPAKPLDTPFQCGFMFSSDESGTDALRLRGSSTRDPETRTVFERWYGYQLAANEVDYYASVSSGALRGFPSARDPASHESVEKSALYDVPAVGITFVAVRDGAVVGTIVVNDDGTTPGMAADQSEPEDPQSAYLWDLDGVTPCGPESIEGAEIYAVLGFGQDGNFAYAWKDVSE